jgi:uncharacterized protein
MNENETTVGSVTEIWRYPVKAFAGESVVDSANIGWHGITADRRYAFVKSGNQTGFPWLTLPDCPALVHYRGFLADPANDRSSPVMVSTPAGMVVAVNDPALLAEIKEVAKCDVHLLQHQCGVFDCADISVITDKTLTNLGAMIGAEPDVRRFRPNLVVTSSEDRPFPEDKWVGGVLVFGNRSDSTRVHVNRKDPRCPVTGVNPVTGEKTDMIPKGIIQHRNNLAGVYGTTQFCGTVQVGDPVRLIMN